jgi:hypothetical protein
MQSKTKRFRLSVNGSYPPVPAQGLMGTIVTSAVAVVLLVGAFVVSVFVFAIVATAALLVGGYLWWKTRELRRQLRAQKGRVIEGEVVRDSSSQ